MARLGATAVGVDQSSGIERAREHFEPGDEALDLHYVQGNLMDAPFAPESFDVVFSAGVLHHTPDTRKAFQRLAPLVKPGGRFYMWLYRHEPFVTPVVNALRVFTTRLPAAAFFGVALAMSPAFQVFTRLSNLTGLRAYQPMSWRASALALMDIFGARYAHAHSYDEVGAWYAEAGFDQPRLVTMERRGFSVCGRKR
jgi:SAM-dependent methyltransferase